MRTSELKQLIITLLSSARKPDEPRQVIGLTYRQISERIGALLPPSQDEKSVGLLVKRIDEQLEVLESEFEIASKGEGRKTFRMAPPALIVEREVPLRAKYVGDRAYMNEVIDLIDAVCGFETRVMESSKSVDEAREILESRGITVQTENMLYEFLPEPQLPTQVDLSMAEQLCAEEISTNMEVYVPRRMNFFDKRWVSLAEALPSEMSQLRRIKQKTVRFGQFTYSYFWATSDALYRLQRKQALLAMYRIDLDANAARLLDIDSRIPVDIKSQLPFDYCVLLARYADEIVLESRTRGGNDERQSRYLQVKSKYKSLLTELLESKLGINKPMN
ncbi:MAG: hypothetical protein KME02_14035 [Aphanothece saxicola GSE-SYN-MK-01-06B]|jgi:hypothetical protein|nr:hypothetical protein [Aphanothece saxicola GSE-SYN-MK-01-06B]